MNVFDPSSLALVGSIGAIALSCVMGFIAANFQIRRSRLPDATAFEDIRERRITEEQRFNALREEARLIEQQIKEKDRVSAEVAALQERLEVLRLESGSLETARVEIEDVKRQAAEVAGVLATALQDRRAVEEELSAKRQELEEIVKILGPDRIRALKDAIDALTHERSALEAELPPIRAERDAALQRIEEARASQARSAALGVEIKRQEDELTTLTALVVALRGEKSDLEGRRELQDKLNDEIGRLEARRDGLESAIDELKRNRDSLDAVRTEFAAAQSSLAAVQSRSEELEQQVVRLEARQSGLLSAIDELERNRQGLDAVRSEFTAAQSSLTTIRSRQEELEEEVVRLEVRRDRLIGDTAGKPKETALLLEDIRQFPACLVQPAILARVAKPESDALAAVFKYLSDCDLQYNHRTLNAFHTSLKINDQAQITVLAGVSGTGKSMLPRRYAEAMGIHFHQIAVEPRWDSPQDLLGFYNYIEQKFRATDLSRLMVHMDPYRSVPGDDKFPDRRNHMALVLLDEMNLARVEYYFSEFLSRLEVRPRLADADDEARRKNAMIPIDIRGYDKTLALFPSHNILFAGTMNDDESTQALSDKVLDRGNVLQFAAPRKFDAHTGRPNPSVPSDALPFSSWKGWLRKIDFLGHNLSDVDAHISKLATIMGECGRPFGHRLRDAVLVYAANYPKPASGAQDLRIPIVDQIELRILPKLRGLEINGHNAALSDLETMIRTDLNDPPLADHLKELIERQGRGTGLFNWRGFTR
jgi:hypothetical protein